MLQYLIGGTVAWDPNPIAHLLAALPLMLKGVWPDGALQALIWLDEQLHSITIIYDVLLAAPNQVCYSPPWLTLEISVIKKQVLLPSWSLQPGGCNKL